MANKNFKLQSSLKQLKIQIHLNFRVILSRKHLRSQLS